MTHSIGDIITLRQDFEAKRALTGTPIILRKGTEGIVLADTTHPSVLFHNGCYIALPVDDRVDDTVNLAGIATWLMYHLEKKFDICEKMEEFELTGDLAEVYIALHSCLLDGLRDLGFKESVRSKDEN